MRRGRSSPTTTHTTHSKTRQEAEQDAQVVQLGEASEGLRDGALKGVEAELWAAVHNSSSSSSSNSSSSRSRLPGGPSHSGAEWCPHTHGHTRAPDPAHLQCIQLGEGAVGVWDRSREMVPQQLEVLQSSQRGQGLRQGARHAVVHHDAARAAVGYGGW